MEKSEGLAYWKDWVDVSVGERSRWHSAQRGMVQTSDLLGDHLVTELWNVTCAGEGGEAAPICADELMHQLRTYEREPRLLAKLADTGRVVQAIERTITTAFETLDLCDPEVLRRWRQQLQRERDQRLQLYGELVKDTDSLCVELGGERQQVELQTLLIHGLKKYGHVLTAEELDVISTVFDALAMLSGMVVTAVPRWLATTEREWYDAVVSPVDGGEEMCLREVSVWAELYHPNVCKVYGACHVGEAPFVIHEQVMPVDRLGLNWKTLLGCGRGVLYAHEQGLVYQSLDASKLVIIPGDKGALSGQGLVWSNVSVRRQYGGFDEDKLANERKRSKRTLDNRLYLVM